MVHEQDVIRFQGNIVSPKRALNPQSPAHHSNTEPWASVDAESIVSNQQKSQ